MLFDLLSAPSPDQISQVISHAIAPSFLLGAVAAFVSLLYARLNNVVDRIRELNALPEAQHAKSHLREDLPRLRKRAQLINRAIYYSVLSGIVATLLVIFSFALAFLGVRHVFGAGLLFLVSVSLLAVALITLALEVRIALNEYDHHSGSGGRGGPD